jgi:peptidoglycan/xylan/chitin deacetylase (PgdA/CDA1 family)
MRGRYGSAGIRGTMRDRITLCKSAIKRGLVKSKLLRILGSLGPARLAVLKYHSVLENPERFANSIGSGIVHPASIFREQMEVIAREFNPVTMDDVLIFLKREITLPPRPVVVTFDDGFEDNFSVAGPILDHVGVRATFYVIVDSIQRGRPPWFCRLKHAFSSTQRETWSDSVECVDRQLETMEKRRAAFLVASERCSSLVGSSQEEALRHIERELDVDQLSVAKCPMMTWEQVTKLRRSGHLIGSHSLSHPNMAHLNNDDLTRELTESKRKLEVELGEAIVHFSYPNPILQPHYTRRTVDGTRKAGYQTAVTCTPGLVWRRDSPLSLGRVLAPFGRYEFLWNLECSFLGRRM